MANVAVSAVNHNHCHLGNHQKRGVCDFDDWINKFCVGSRGPADTHPCFPGGLNCITEPKKQQFTFIVLHSSR